MHGTDLSISLGPSCPSDCASGHTGSDQWALVLEDGLFSGYKEDAHAYDRSSWDYELDAQGYSKIDDTWQHPCCVINLLRQHVSRYMPEMVSRICGTPQENTCRSATTAAPDKTLASLFALGQMTEGPFAEHYEPFESQVSNVLHPKVQSNPAARVFADDRAAFGSASEFPYVATTYRLTERFHLWTRHALINSMVRPMMVDGKATHVIGVPIHWGFTCQSRKGYGADTLPPPSATPIRKPPS
jgi:anaerobic selenocysteine-containing dehydrogenase